MQCSCTCFGKREEIGFSPPQDFCDLPHKEIRALQIPDTVAGFLLSPFHLNERDGYILVPKEAFKEMIDPITAHAQAIHAEALLRRQINSENDQVYPKPGQTGADDVAKGAIFAHINEQETPHQMDIPNAAGEQKQRLYERLYVAAEDLGHARQYAQHLLKKRLVLSTLGASGLYLYAAIGICYSTRC